MTLSRLESVSIQNFRSIGGRITIPLGAQVVLIHGANGTGKTSVLSAIELALTGSIDSLERLDQGYKNHLVNRGASTAEVDLTATEGTGEQRRWRLSSDQQDWAHQSALGAQDAAFFKERCYLAQSVLGRLLEIYEASTVDHESALTRFVNDVLGLDAVEALIAGLRDARDIRNTRHLVPGISSVEREIKAVERDQLEVDERANRLQADLARIESLIQDAAVSRSVAGEAVEGATGNGGNSTAGSLGDEETLNRLTVHRRDLEAMRRRAGRVATDAVGERVRELEQRAHESAAIAEAWVTSAGSGIETILELVRSEFADVPSTAESSPTEAVDRALSRAAAEAKICAERLRVDDERRAQEQALQSRLSNAQSRLAVINEQIADMALGAGELSRILTDLIPHIARGICPVCGRPYAEVSEEPLESHVAHRSARLSEEADRLAALSHARSEAAEEIAGAADELEVVRARRIESSVRSDLVVRQAKMDSWSRMLERVEQEAARGSGILQTSAADRRALVDLRERARDLSDIRIAATELAIVLSVEHSDTTESLGGLIARLLGAVDRQSTDVAARIALKQELSALETQKRAAAEALAVAKATRTEVNEKLASLRAIQNAFEAKRRSARELLAVASRTKDSIVRAVFSDSLNHVWRDLFVRLAPHEPFVPAFRFDAKGPASTPRLSTIYRGDVEGGNPGAMLSAGNLNTAALTLFLALHLSAKDRLPMLVLDDPVQSMDDLHISQLAALLRTLVRQHGRQVVVAVHERALFEYLAFELNPAFAGEKLITVELSKRADGSTHAEPVVREWREDSVQIPA